MFNKKGAGLVVWLILAVVLLMLQLSGCLVDAQLIALEINS